MSIILRFEITFHYITNLIYPIFQNKGMLYGFSKKLDRSRSFDFQLSPDFFEVYSEYASKFDTGIGGFLTSVFNSRRNGYRGDHCDRAEA